MSEKKDWLSEFALTRKSRQATLMTCVVCHRVPMPSSLEGWRLLARKDHSADYPGELVPYLVCPEHDDGRSSGYHWTEMTHRPRDPLAKRFRTMRKKKEPPKKRGKKYRVQKDPEVLAPEILQALSLDGEMSTMEIVESTRVVMSDVVKCLRWLSARRKIYETKREKRYWGLIIEFGKEVTCH